MSSSSQRGPSDELSANLKTLRERARLSLAEVAAAVGVTKGAVHGWEQGSEPGREKLERLAELYGTTVQELRFGPAPREAPAVARGLPKTIRVWIHDFLGKLVRAGVSEREVELARQVLTSSEMYRALVGSEPQQYSEEETLLGIQAHAVAIETVLRSRGYEIPR